MNAYLHAIPVPSKQVMLWYPVDTLYSHTYVLLCSRIECLTPGTTSLLSYQPVIPVTPGAIEGHITTKLHELETVLDAGRGGWRP